MNEIFNIVRDGPHIMNFTFAFHWYQYDLPSWIYEANELKTKSLFGGKQLKGKT